MAMVELPCLPPRARPGRRRGRLSWRIAWVLALGALTDAVAQPPATSLEYQVKAAFLYNFAKYVDWPHESINRGDTFDICVFGQSPFDTMLDQTLHGKAVHDRRLMTHQIQEIEAARDCHILFISASETSHLPEILQQLDGASVLTVGEVGPFAEQGGMINFRMQNGNVRFEINLDAAQRSGLKISSQLLKLATNVIGRPRV